MGKTLDTWSAAFRKAAQGFVGPPGADQDPTLIVALTVPGRVQGAVRVRVPFARANLTEAARLGEVLAGVNADPVSHPIVVWKGVCPAPLKQGQAVDLELEELPGCDVLEHLHIEQSIQQARKLSEDSVLAVGNEVRGIMELANHHSEGLHRVADQFSDGAAGSGDTTMAATMNKLADRLKSFGDEVVDRTNRQARDIEQARQWSHDIVKLGQSIATIASNARILTFNARLESARIGEAGRGFAVIAASIQDLATHIRQTNQAVSDLAANLLKTLPRLGIDSAETARSARESIGGLDTQLRSALAHLGDARAASFDALKESAQAARDLQDKANHVIVHLQFQDRASQMMDDIQQQTSAVMQVAGLVEQHAPDRVKQVGAIGRTIDSSAPIVESGAVLLF